VRRAAVDEIEVVGADRARLAELGRLRRDDDVEAGAGGGGEAGRAIRAAGARGNAKHCSRRQRVTRAELQIGHEQGPRLERGRVATRPLSKPETAVYLVLDRLQSGSRSTSPITMSD